MWGASTLRASANEELGTLAEYDPLTGYEPNDLHISETNPPATARPQTYKTWRSMTTPSEERSLRHCSLRSKKIQRAVDKLITLLTKACCQVSRCLSVMFEQVDLFPMSLDHQFQTSGKIHVATRNDKKSRFSLIIEQRFRNTSSRPIMTKEIFEKLNGVVGSQRDEINRALQGDEQF